MLWDIFWTMYYFGALASGLQPLAKVCAPGGPWREPVAQVQLEGSTVVEADPEIHGMFQEVSPNSRGICMELAPKFRGTGAEVGPKIRMLRAL